MPMAADTLVEVITGKLPKNSITADAIDQSTHGNFQNTSKKGNLRSTRSKGA
jgi:hypothetical protein